MTVDSLGGSDIETFSNRLFNRWGVGEKKDNRGVMFVVAKNDRRMRFECGYGAESVVPDAVAKRIILETVTPAFKSGRFGDGITGGCRAVMARFGYDAGGAPPVSASNESAPPPSAGTFIFLPILFFIIFLAITRGRSNGGGFGGRGGFSSGGWSGGSSGSGGGWSGSGGGSSGGGGASGSW